MQVTDEMVTRFLTWPVPADVYPDGTPGQPGRTGTNLMTAGQAKQMLAHVLAEVPCSHGIRSPHECKECADEVGDAEISAFMRAQGLGA